jgi:hypothetical protein
MAGFICRAIRALGVYHYMATHDTMNNDNTTNDIFMSNDMSVKL